MLKSVRNTLLAGVAATALAASVAWAQTPPPPSMPRQDMRAHRMAQMCKEMPAVHASRLAYLEVKLGLTEPQRAAWNSFAQDMRAAGQPMLTLCDNPPKTADQADAAAMLSAREQSLSAMLESTKLARAAVEKLQPVLTAEQKVTLAEYTRRVAGRGMGHHRHMRGGMHHGPAGGPPAAPAPR